MTFDHDPRRLWAPPLMELGLMPWHMDMFSPSELTAVADWQADLEKQAKRRAARGKG